MCKTPLFADICWIFPSTFVCGKLVENRAFFRKTFDRISFPPAFTDLISMKLRKCGCFPVNAAALKFIFSLQSNRLWISFSVKFAPGPILAANMLYQFIDLIVENPVVFDHLFYLLTGVHHGRVMLPAELPADLRKAVFRQSFAQVHRHLPRE